MKNKKKSFMNELIEKAAMKTFLTKENRDLFKNLSKKGIKKIYLITGCEKPMQ